MFMLHSIVPPCKKLHHLEPHHAGKREIYIHSVKNKKMETRDLGPTNHKKNGMNVSYI